MLSYNNIQIISQLHLLEIIQLKMTHGVFVQLYLSLCPSRQSVLNVRLVIECHSKDEQIVLYAMTSIF